MQVINTLTVVLSGVKLSRCLAYRFSMADFLMQMGLGKNGHSVPPDYRLHRYCGYL
jgi:hypothetical protein